MPESTSVPGDLRLTEPLPEVDLRQLLRLTDDTGLLQHATHLLPDPNHGYCTDDNARALIAAVLHARLYGYDEQVVPLQRYLGFVAYAFNPETGRFRNFMGYDRRWIEEAGSEDSHGRAMWALGITVRDAPNTPIHDFAYQLLHKGLEAVRDQLGYPWPWAFSLLGLCACLERHDDAAVHDVRDRLAHQLHDQWRRHATDDWPWWEDRLTWGIARLPHAMLVAGHDMGHQDMVDAGLAALRWCLDVETAPEGHLSIVGNDGWYLRGQGKAQFDQQPLEAHGLVDACLTAARITSEPQWVRDAWRCFRWFLGDNDLKAPLYSPETGGCYDGLTPNGPNQNQGAESSLAYLLSLLTLDHYHQHHQHKPYRPRPAHHTTTHSAAPHETDAPEAARPHTVGLAVIGTGRFGQFAARQFRTLPEVRLRVVADIDPDAARRAAEALAVDAAASVDEALSRDDVEMVYIASPPWTHREVVEKALRANCHVLCEKPLALSLDDAQAMLALAQQRRRLLTTNLLMRYNPLCEAVKRIIDQRLLGEPLHGYFENHAKDEPLPPDHWFWDRRKSGGIFVEHGVHFFDLFEWWLGECQLEAAQSVYRPGTCLIEQVQCTCRYGTDVLVNFHHSFTQPEVMDRQELCLVLERGTLRLYEWVATSMTLECLLDERVLATLQALLPHAVVERVESYSGSACRMTSRHKSYAVEGRYRISADTGMTKPQLYGHVLRSLLADQIAALRDPTHVRTVSERNGYDALTLAIGAQHLAEAYAR